jgi:hypothetical protein
MAAKKRKAKKSVSKAKRAPSRKTKAPRKAKTSAKKVKRPARKAAKRPAKKAKAAARKAPARKALARKARPAAKKKKQIMGEGDYAASRAFLKDQSGFVEKNKAAIPAMGKAAENALEGPEGDSLRDAEATAAARSRDTF